MTNERTMELLCFQKAEKLWPTLSEGEKNLVRFGMFPRVVMEAAVKEGFDSRLLSVALMKVAKVNGGMVC